MIIPLWVLSVVLLIETIVFLWVHIRLSFWEQMAILIPSVFLAALYIIFYIDDSVPLHIQSASGRISFFAWVGWHTILLILTRKRHL